MKRDKVIPSASQSDAVTDWRGYAASVAPETKWEKAVNRLIAAVEKAANRLPVARPPRQPSTRLHLHPGQANLLLSDIQIGSRVDVADTYGLSSYSWKQFEKQADKLLSTAQVLTQDMKMVYNLRRLNLLCLGDYVEGELIYPGQQLSIDTILADQIVKGAYVVSRTIRDMSALYDEVWVYCVIGNHGRLGNKRQPMARRSNAGYLFCKFLELLLKEHKRIRIIISDSARMAFKLYDWTFMIGHGDDTRGWLGIPFYGIERDTLRLRQMMHMSLDYVCPGHHHRPAAWSISGLQVMMNGSWQGGTSFSVANMKSVEPPSQKFFILHPERGKTYEADIKLADSHSLVVDANCVYTPVAGKE